MSLFRALRRSLGEVFSTVRYTSIAGGAALLALAVSVWLNNVNLLKSVIGSPLFTLPEKLLLLVRLLGGVHTAMTPLAALLLIAVSVAFGVNAAFLLYVLVHRRSALRAGTSGGAAAGVISAVFGAGCASCGTYVLGAMLASVGASGLLAFLPLGGQEFLAVSLGLLIASLLWTSRSLQTANVCDVPAVGKPKT